MSTDDTAAVARRFWENKPPTDLRVVHEPRLGLSHARRRGLAEATYEIVSFIDDDNWVCENWVHIVFEIMKRYPDVGACGGVIEAVCEVTPPCWFSRYEAAYAIGTQGSGAGDVSGTRGFLWGAGLSIRQAAWQELVNAGFRALLLDRTGDTAHAGGDAELSFALRLAGWRLWYEPRLKLKHFVPAQRLEWNYLRNLYRGFGACSVVLDLYSFALRGRPKTPRERLTRTWEWNSVAALIKLLWYQSKVLLSLDRRSEGKSDILQLEVRIGRLSELIRSRKSYARQFLPEDKCCHGAVLLPQSTDL
jgi:glycosyltransferase involved in cell wall biosynthesis